MANNLTQIGSDTSWIKIKAGRKHFASMKDDNSLWSWGDNDSFQVWPSSASSVESPIQISNDTNWSDVACGGYHTITLKYSMVTFPINVTFAETNSLTPEVTIYSDSGRTEVVGSIDMISLSFMFLEDGNYWYTAVIDGYDNYDGDFVMDGSNITEEFEMTESSAGIPGGIYAWGQNSSGQLGLGDTNGKADPVYTEFEDAIIVATGMYISAAIKSNGTLWTWGDNGWGQLGHVGMYEPTSKSSPVQVGSDTNWSKVACGDYYWMLAVKSDGTLWSWGYNNYGQLGLGDRTNRSSPTQIGSLTDWEKVFCGQDQSMAVKTDGTLWTWGRNNWGQLGTGEYGFGTDKSSPTQIGSLTDWDKLTGGSSFSIAIKTDGTLWAWGRNWDGELGLSPMEVEMSMVPIQVGTDTWIDVSSGTTKSYGVQTDGTLWLWGAGGS